jgi:hypothetical protein
MPNFQKSFLFCAIFQLCELGAARRARVRNFHDSGVRILCLICFQHQIPASESVIVAGACGPGFTSVPSAQQKTIPNVFPNVSHLCS